MIVETDDYFCHQIVEPHAHVLSNDPSWADRAYITISDANRFGMDIGVSMYPNNDAIETYAIASTPRGIQRSMRASRDLSAGRFPLWAGPSRFDIIEPLRHWKMTCEPNDSGISYDLEFRARALPYEMHAPEVRKKRRVIHTDIYIFQPGRVDGTLTLGEETFELENVDAHRDRTWGLRAAGEGILPHGVLAWISADLPGYTIVAQIRDRGDDTPQFRDGAISYHDTGRVVPIVDFEHDMEFDYDTRQMVRGRFKLVDAEGKKYDLESRTAFRIYLTGAGYVTEERRRRGRQGNSLWQETWDLNDPKVVAAVEGLNDNISFFTCNGEEGLGVVETCLGEHVRYKAAPFNVV